MRLLVTRPEPQGEQTARILRGLGHEVVLAPLLRIELLQADFAVDTWNAVAVTSANAIRAVQSRTRDMNILSLPLFTVGARTAAAARDAGFINVSSADGDAQALATLIAGTMPPGSSLLYLAGENRSRELSDMLAAARIVVRTVEIYRAVPQPTLPPSVSEALRAGTIDGVLHFSTRSVETFLAAVTADGVLPNSLNCHHFCLSAQVAQAFARMPEARVFVAASPDEAAVLDLVGQS